MFFRDIYFDLPKAHSLKNFILSFISKKDRNIYAPSYSRTHRNYYILNRDPYILTVLESINDLQIFSKIIGKNKDIIYLKFFSWTLFDKPGLLDRTIFDYKNHIKKFPKHKIILLLNTPQEFKYFKNNGLECQFINHNALVDPNIFKPRKMRKEYDVIYNGRLELGKRHYLLESCKNLALISGPILRKTEPKLEYLELLKSKIPNADILNYSRPIKMSQLDSFSNMPILTARSVSKILNKSRVGVILSYKEGACYASIEYLLSGLPVISTSNIGGRDIFFDERFCKKTYSNARSLKKTIFKILKENISSDYIRTATLRKMKIHIDKMKILLEKIIIDYGNSNVNIDEYWDEIYINKMLNFGQKFPDKFEKDIIE